jgi:hypothetical protein
MKRIILALLCLTPVGCADRSHMSPGYGKSYREFQARQTANPGAGERDLASKGLDTQEAALIAGGYRKGLARKGQEVPNDPGLLQTSEPKGRNPPASER